MNCSSRIVLGIIAVVAGLSGSASATTLNVPWDYPTIQAAIDAATPLDTIAVAAGVFTEDINFNGHSNLLYSMGGASSTTIVGTITINNGESANAIVRGFTVDGGRVETSLSSPRFENCVFENGSGSLLGGAVHCWGGSPFFADCIFRNNTSSYAGGALEFFATIDGRAVDCTFIGNSVNGNSSNGGGGAVSFRNGSGSVTR